jgi:serine/threonine-protein kinase
MAVTNLGPCEWFVWDIRRSHLMSAEAVDEAVGAFLKQHPEGEPPALAQYMVQEHLLTPFQAERLLQGKSQDLVLGPYTLLEAVGSGSMGTVYRAISGKDRKPYAVKVLPRRSMWNARMARRQVTAFEKCKHAAVVPFVDVGTAGAMHYLAWPFVEGESLQSLVQRTGRLEPMQAADYALQVAEGLAACHQNDLIHGMLKPSNLMLGSDQKIRILDYGVGALLAQGDAESLVDTRSTANVLAAGLDCVSPECILDPSKRSGASDQYSLGCVLYFCLSGRLPFEGTAAEKLQAHQAKQPEPIRSINPEVPEALAAVLDRLMQKEPTARYADMSELIAALSSIVNPRPEIAVVDQAISSVPTETAAVVPAPAATEDPIAPTPAESPKVHASSTPTPIPEVTPEPPIRVDASPTQPLPEVPELAASLVKSENAPSSAVAPTDPAVTVELPISPVKSGVTALPEGATKVLGKVSRRAASEFSVFDMPPLDFKPLPPRKPEVQPVATVAPIIIPPQKSAPEKPAVDTPVFQKPAPESNGAAPLETSSPPMPSPKVPQPSLEERLGPRGVLALTLSVVFFVFLVGYLLFSH